MRPLIVLLILVCLALSGGLYLRHTKALKQEQQDVAQITQLSNKVVYAEQELIEQTSVNAALTSTNSALQGELVKTSNMLVNVTATLQRVQEEAKVAAETAAADIAKRDQRISELETQRDDLTKRMTDLNAQISTLDSAIGDAQRKLAASEGDREFLLKELKRMQVEKTELERQFNDLAMLREQVRKLRDELSVTRRLDWIRRGLYGQLKGAERLQRGFQEKQVQQASASTNYDLNVELKQSGEVNVNQPARTNAPANPATPAGQTAPK
jgi:chromosome segregation ATPase